jgi:hypothetical protein
MRATPNREEGGRAPKSNDAKCPHGAASIGDSTPAASKCAVALQSW